MNHPYEFFNHSTKQLIWTAAKDAVFFAYVLQLDKGLKFYRDVICLYVKENFNYEHKLFESHLNRQETFRKSELTTHALLIEVD